MSIKKLQREIMLSATYQLSTEDNKADFEKDSGNRLYWRANRKRMDAEQIRDAVLDVAGNLDTMEGGPSHELTPDFTGRTVYGKVSRYKLDAYLQLFDFPPPNISAEKRFTTTVPLQRLFLMNSDFVQLEAEALAKRVAAEPDNRARIRKMYTLTYGRLPSEEEIQIGLAYLHSEPMKEYEEDKAKSNDKHKDDKHKNKDGGSGPEVITSAALPGGVLAKPAAAGILPDAPDVSADPAKPADAEGGAEADAAPNAGMGMGMMGGMGLDGRKGQAPKEIKYEPTAWGRYAKVLLSSTEFIFIN